jgi:hypothetical protein
MTARVPESTLTTEELLTLSRFRRELADALDAALIGNGDVSLAEMADIATSRFIGRVTAGTGVPEALTGTQATTLLNAFTSSLKGLAPASGGGTTNYLRADGTWTDPPGDSLGWYNVEDYSLVGDGVTDNRAAFQALIAIVIAAGGGTIYFPAGTYSMTRATGAAYSINMAGCRNIAIRGEPGQSVITQPDDVASGGTLCRMLFINDCVDLDIYGMVFDGNWGNAVTQVKVESDQVNLAALPGNVLYVESTTGFPASGSFTYAGRDDDQILTYTGKTSTTFTGVSAGTGYLREGEKIVLGDLVIGFTTIAAGSDGQSLPQATINVASTSNFATSASSGVAQVTTASGIQSIAYTGKTGTTLTGCTGGVGVMSTGGLVTYNNAELNQNDPRQIDPKNTPLFIYGSDGSLQTENKNITVRNCKFVDVYGDAAWVGAWSYDVKFIDCVFDTCARNGVTVSNWAEGVHFERCCFYNILITAIDAEPVEGPTNHVIINDCDLGIWANPYRSTSNSPLSISGGTVSRAAEWNMSMHWRVSNSRIHGTVLGSGVRDIELVNNWFQCDSDTGSGPIAFYGHCDDVLIEGNYFNSRVTPDSSLNYGCVNIRRYDAGANSSVVPGNIIIRNNTMRGRNGVGGVYVEPGGYSGATGSASGITAASAPSTAGTLTDAGAGWSVDYWIGHQVLMGGKLANITANTAEVLTLAPLFENYTAGSGLGLGTSWADSRGNPVPAPSIGTYVIKPIGARVQIDHNVFDLVDDGDGAGSFGVKVDGDSGSVNWALGYNDARVSITHNDTRGATGPAIHVIVPGTTVPMKDITIVGNHAWDDQPTPTCTYGLFFENDDQITSRTIHGNTVDDPDTIAPVGGLLSGSWNTGGGHPQTWAGFEDPNGLIFAPAGSVYARLNSRTTYIKESSEDFDTSWIPVKTQLNAAVRGYSTPMSGTGALTWTADEMPPSVRGDIELLIIGNTNSGSDPGEATLTTAARFVRKVHDDSNYSADTIRSRGSVWWRRFIPGDIAPIVADSGQFNAAVIISVKDCIGYGDPINVTASAGNDALTMSVSVPTATTTVDNCFVLDVVTWFNGGNTCTIAGWANADLSELTEEFDNHFEIGGDDVGIAVNSGRAGTATAVDATTATIDGPTYAVWVAMKLALIPAVDPFRASGTITCTTKANYADTDYMTIGDGIGVAKVYEFDTAGDGVTAGRVQVNISASVSAADVAAVLRTAILANQPALGVVDAGSGVLTITHNWAGSGGNITITENVVNAGHTVSGMSGGQG